VWLSGRVGAGTDTGSLDLGPLDLVGQGGTSPKEVFVVIAVLVTSTSESLEAIEVELSLEGTHLGELEVSGEQLLEFLGLADDKAAAVRLPADHIAVAISFHFVKHLVEANGKWSSNTAAGWAVFNAVVLIGMVVVVVLNDNVRMMFATGRAWNSGGSSWFSALNRGCLHEAHGTGVDRRLHLVKV
jgi:hypothetical protein